MLTNLSCGDSRLLRLHRREPAARTLASLVLLTVPGSHCPGRAVGAVRSDVGTTHLHMHTLLGP